MNKRFFFIIFFLFFNIYIRSMVDPDVTTASLVQDEKSSSTESFVEVPEEFPERETVDGFVLIGVDENNQGDSTNYSSQEDRSPAALKETVQASLGNSHTPLVVEREVVLATRQIEELKKQEEIILCREFEEKYAIYEKLKFRNVSEKLSSSSEGVNIQDREKFALQIFNQVKNLLIHSKMSMNNGLIICLICRLMIIKQVLKEDSLKKPQDQFISDKSKKVIKILISKICFDFLVHIVHVNLRDRSFQEILTKMKWQKFIEEINNVDFLRELFSFSKDIYAKFLIEFQGFSEYPLLNQINLMTEYSFSKLSNEIRLINNQPEKNKGLF